MKKLAIIVVLFCLTSEVYAQGGYYQAPGIGTAIGDLTQDFMSIPGNVIIGSTNGFIDGFKRPRYRSAPAYNYGYGYGRPWWLNGPYVEAGYPAAIGVPVYSAPPVQYVEKVIYVQQEPAQQKPVSNVSIVNSGNTINNSYYGDSSPPAQKVEKRLAKKTKKALKTGSRTALGSDGIIHPTKSW